MATAPSRRSPASKPTRGSRFMMLSLLVMAAALTYLGWQMRGNPGRRTPAAPATAPAHTTSPGGRGGNSSAPANPNFDRNG